MKESDKQRELEANDAEYSQYVGSFNGYDQAKEDAALETSSSSRTLYVDGDHYEQYTRMRTRSAFFLRFVGSFGLYALLLVFLYFGYLQMSSMVPGESDSAPSWAMLYIPVLLVFFLRAFNALSMVKISLL
jgi:hypothetical protein